MNLSDIISYFSAAADGQRMTNEPLGAINQVMGGRGVINPPMVTPNAAPPQMTRARPSRPMQVAKDEAGFEDMIARIMAGGSTDELQNAPSVGATPLQAAMQPDLPAPAAQEVAAAAPASQAPTAAPVGQGEQPGIMSRMFDNSRTGVSPFEYAMRALGAAGSQDPMKTAMQFSAQDAENDKIREARRRANQPKVEQIAGTPFSRVTMPDGSFRDVPSAALAEYYKSQSENKAATKRSDMELQADLNAKAAADKSSNKLAADNTPDISDGLAGVASLRRLATQLGSIDPETKQFVKKSDNLTGPLVGVASKVPVLGPAFLQPAIDLQENVEQEIVKTLRATLGAQFTEKEGVTFARRGYNPNLDEKANYDRINQRASDLEFMLKNKSDMVKWYKENRSLDGFLESLMNRQPADARATGGVLQGGALVPKASKKFLDNN